MDSSQFPVLSSRWRSRRRGTVLIVAIGVITILAALVLTMARSMRVEAMTSANFAAQVQAEAVEQAGEQYAIALIVDQADAALHLDESNFAQVPVGDAGYFWIIRPNYDDPTLSLFGLVDESSKINLNGISNVPDDTFRDALVAELSGMTEDMGDALRDWKTPNSSDVSYSMLPSPYQAKSSSLESVEESLLVRGFTREYLYGQQMAAGQCIPYGASTGMVGSGSAGNTGGVGFDPSTYRGIWDYVTVYSANGGTPAAQGQININTAPREVLALLKAPGIGTLTDGDIDSLITQRQSAVQSDPTDNTWAQQILNGKVQNAYITTQAFQYSADILAVSANGRAFKRVRVIVDIKTGTPKIIYRRDLTEFGWPIASPTLDEIRQGGLTGGGIGSGSVRRTM